MTVFLAHIAVCKLIPFSSLTYWIVSFSYIHCYRNLYEYLLSHASDSLLLLSLLGLRKMKALKMTRRNKSPAKGYRETEHLRLLLLPRITVLRTITIPENSLLPVLRSQEEWIQTHSTFTASGHLCICNKIKQSF